MKQHLLAIFFDARWIPYALTAVGLIGGLVVILFAPFPVGQVNAFVGGVLLFTAIISVTYMIIEFSGPGERGPNF